MVALALAVVGCSDGGSGADACPALEGDLLNVNPVYTADREPLVILRLDLAGDCAGTGEETYVVWRSGAPEILGEPVAVHPTDLPESAPGSFMYQYRTLGLVIDVQRNNATDVTLAFIDGSDFPPALRCRDMSGVLTCEAV